MRRWPHLDGLRGLAALLVLLSHGGFWTGATAHGAAGGLLARGDSGVALFFALSAFLLAGPWLLPSGASPTDTPLPAIGTYAARRAARLLPAYLLVLVAVLGAAAAGLGDGIGGWGRVAGHLTLAQGWTGDVYQGFSQSWSLTHEVVFYSALPLLGRAVRRRGVPGIVVVGLVIGGFALALGHVLWFLVGVGILWLRSTGRPLPPALAVLTGGPGTMVLVAAAAYAVAATGVAGPRDLAPATLGESMTKEVLYAVVAGALLLAATAESAAGARWWDNPVARFLGRISYGVFLWHVLVLQIGYAAFGLPLFSGHAVLVTIGVLVTTMLLASLSWWLLEGPVLRWAHRATQAASPGEDRERSIRGTAPPRPPR